MPRYTISHAYRSARDGVTFGPWVEGDEVELEEADAAWVERDSPGALTQPEPVERQAEPKPNRQQRGTKNRSA